MFHSCWLELLAWEVGDMGADITGRVERRIRVQGENRDGFYFSPTAQFGQLTSLVYLLQTPALLQPLAVSIPPNIGPFRDWLEGCDSFLLRSLLELTTETCQHAHPHPDPCLVFLPLPSSPHAMTHECLPGQEAHCSQTPLSQGESRREIHCSVVHIQLMFCYFILFLCLIYTVC